MAPKKVVKKRTAVAKKKVEPKQEIVEWSPPDDALMDGQERSLEPSPSPEDSGEKPKKKLRRWGTENYADRCIKEKLSGYDADEMKTARGKTTGLSVEEYIKRKHKETRGDGENLAGDFWIGFWREFKLTCVRFQVLDGPGVEMEEGEVSDDIVNSLAVARSKNPADRGKGVELFINTLEYLEHVGIMEVKFMIFMSKECESVSKKANIAMMTKVLKVCGRLRVHHRYPVFWNLVRADFDAVLHQHVAIKAPSTLLRPQFVYGLKDAFEALFGFEHIVAVEDAFAKKAEAPVDHLMKILSSKTGRLLYSAEGATYRYKIFLAGIEERLVQLEEHSYCPEEMESFKNIMALNTKQVMEGMQVFEAKPCIFAYFNCKMSMQIITIRDEWQYRLTAKMTTLAVSRNLLPRMPWEELLFGKQDPLPGWSECIGVPDLLLSKAYNMRTAVRRQLSGYQWATFEDMHSVLLAQEGVFEEAGLAWKWICTS